jgi:hypothetical protein
MIVGKYVLPAERRVDADVEGLGEGDELVARVARSFAAYLYRVTGRLASLSRLATNLTISSGAGAVRI